MEELAKPMVTMENRLVKQKPTEERESYINV